MTISPTIELVTRPQWISSKIAETVVALVAFALLSGIWLAYFTFVPFDFRIR